MTKLSVGMLAVLSCVSASAFAELPFTALRPSGAITGPVPDEVRAIAEMEGIVEAVDTQRGLLILKDSLDHSRQVYVAAQTPINDITRGSIKLSDLHKDQKVRVYYTPADMRARQVDIDAHTLAEFLLYPA